MGQSTRIETPMGYARVTLNKSYLFIAYFNAVDTLLDSKWFIAEPEQLYKNGWVMDTLLPLVERHTPKGKR